MATMANDLTLADVYRLVDGHRTQAEILELLRARGMEKKGVKPGEVIVPPHVYHYGTGKGDTEFGEFGQRPRGRYATKRMRFAAQRVDRRDTWRERPETDLAQERPAVTLEPMASGDILVKSTSSDVYRLLRRTYEDAVAIDMPSCGPSSNLTADCRRSMQLRS